MVILNDIPIQQKIYARNFEIKLLMKKVDKDLKIEQAIELLDEFCHEEFLKIKNVRFMLFNYLSGE